MQTGDQVNWFSKTKKNTHSDLKHCNIDSEKARPKTGTTAKQNNPIKHHCTISSRYQQCREYATTLLLALYSIYTIRNKFSRF